ncbi:hypothetical protein BD324DRAFT_603993 [Kockovaella imperatae]|uniref:FeS cluster biogenesis domain-containing protein n=1 Tax=Kockovaella imperatae TaxID=4999 RepID=A0A1Y1UC56_9TREE|nr:hypothetical protein BD324DRAFT_603993 [Kockovaella imperatae]ORX35114.1 hypothetical protein BD324DRAFT_603993 [Kockovaella imperatae]
MPTFSQSSSSSSSSSSPPPPSSISSGSSSRSRIKVTPPSLEAIKNEGYFDDDIALIPPDQAVLDITPSSIRQLVKITSKESPEVLAKGLALRVGVDNGGCHGYQYTMALTEERNVDDYVMQPQGIDCIPVVVDLISLRLLKGSTLHYGSELIGSSFQLMNNPQAKQGGSCGCGVSWEAKEGI